MIAKFANISLTFIFAIFLSGCGNKDVALNDFKDGKVVLWRNKTDVESFQQNSDCEKVLSDSSGLLEFAKIEGGLLLQYEDWGGKTEQEEIDENSDIAKNVGSFFDLQIKNLNLSNNNLSIDLSVDNGILKYYFRQASENKLIMNFERSYTNPESERIWKEFVKSSPIEDKEYFLCTNKSIFHLKSQSIKNNIAREESSYKKIDAAEVLNVLEPLFRKDGYWTSPSYIRKYGSKCSDIKSGNDEFYYLTSYTPTELILKGEFGNLHPLINDPHFSQSNAWKKMRSELRVPTSYQNVRKKADSIFFELHTVGVDNEKRVDEIQLNKKTMSLVNLKNLKCENCDELVMKSIRMAEQGKNDFGTNFCTK